MTSRRIVFIAAVVGVLVSTFVAAGFDSYAAFNGDDWTAQQVADDWWVWSMVFAVVAVCFYWKD